MDETNQGFGIPEVVVAPAAETPEQRMARLQHLADIQIGKETDAEIIERLVAEARAKRAAELLPMDTGGFPAEYDRVEIYEGSGENDLQYVPLTLNGFCIKAPRGTEIILPHVFVTECLDHAIETKVIPVKNASGVSIGIRLKSANRFPYRFIRKATPAEYQVFQKEQKELVAQQLAAAA